MSRNWGLPKGKKTGAFRDAKVEKPVMTLLVSAVFGVLGASLSVIGFAAARDAVHDLYHGASLIAAVISGGFGCWAYVWLARPRIAAQITGERHAFSSLLRFYAQAAVSLSALLLLSIALRKTAPEIVYVAMFCITGGAGAAAAFQTVLAFVPYYEGPKSS